MPVSPIYTKTMVIPSSVIDENGHVNHVAYVQWMQDIAVEHYSSIGGISAQGPEATWVVREHKIKYLLPAFTGEEIEVRTWTKEMRVQFQWMSVLFGNRVENSSPGMEPFTYRLFDPGLPHFGGQFHPPSGFLLENITTP